SVVPAATYTGLSPSQVQEFSSNVMSAEIFGAFLMAFDTRRAESGMTQAQLAERLGKDKTGTSKLLSAPRNWTIRTISDLSVALNVIVEVTLRDRIYPTRVFTSTGVSNHQFPSSAVIGGVKQFDALDNTVNSANTNDPFKPSVRFNNLTFTPTGTQTTMTTS